MSSTVEVVIDVNVDASGVVSVFSYPTEATSNVIVAASPLSKSLFYTDASSALIKFRGWSAGGNVEDVSGIRHGAFVSSNATNIGKLSTVINGNFDCSGAAPFGTYKSTNISQYWSYGSFGEMALGAYAHHLFGHVQATAAIDNDQVFVSDMNSETAGKAQIATRLLAALDAMSPEVATRVAKQVIGQQADRAKSVDNDQDSPDNYQMLEFKSGDIIYLKVTLLAPTVTVSGANPSVQQSEPLSATQTTYMMKITLQN